MMAVMMAGLRVVLKVDMMVVMSAVKMADKKVVLMAVMTVE